MEILECDIYQVNNDDHNSNVEALLWGKGGCNLRCQNPGIAKKNGGCDMCIDFLAGLIMFPKSTIQTF